MAQINYILSMAVCDPSADELTQTSAAIRKVLERIPLGQHVTVPDDLNPEALLADKPCDLCVTEIDLGAMDGFALISKIREGQPDARAIIATRTATNATALKAWKANVDQYLLKPLGNERNLRQLQHILNLIVTEELEKRR